MHLRIFYEPSLCLKEGGGGSSSSSQDLRIQSTDKNVYKQKKINPIQL